MANALNIQDLANFTAAIEYMGIIERNTDVDMFRFDTDGGFINLAISASSFVLTLILKLKFIMRMAIKFLRR